MPKAATDSWRPQCQSVYLERTKRRGAAGSWEGQTGHSEESGGRGSGTTVCPGPLLGDRRLVGGGPMGNALSCCQDLGRVSWEERRAGWTAAAPRPGPRDSPSPPSPPHPGWLRSPPFAELEAWRARPWRTAATVRPPGQATSTVARGRTVSGHRLGPLGLSQGPGHPSRPLPGRGRLVQG